jgi:hypothetical protein
VALDAMLVRSGTALQLQATHAARRAAHSDYVSLALGPGQPPAAHTAGLAALASTLLSGWRLKWDNTQKEILWRLAVDGVASANSRTSWHCPCCPHTDTSPRLHCFWDCPIAHAVRAELSRALQPLTAQPIRRASVWLCQPRPCMAVHPGIWLVVCFAALSAMDHGRRQLWRMHHATQAASASSHASSGRQPTLLELWGHSIPPPPPRTSVMQRACAFAIVDFWGRLESFASAKLAPVAWLSAVGDSHPFLSHGGTHVQFGPLAPPPSSSQSHLISSHLISSHLSPSPISSPSSSSPPHAPDLARPLRQQTLAQLWGTPLAAAASSPPPSSLAHPHGSPHAALTLAAIEGELAGLGWSAS